MIKVLFVCHGNICRSPMAEFVFKKVLIEKGLINNFIVESRATSREEIGNPIHYGTIKMFKLHNIDGYNSKRAQQITKEDVSNFDYILAMDLNNINNLSRMFGLNPKFRLLLDREISDPWYTGDFDSTYKDIIEGLNIFLEEINNNKIENKNNLLKLN